jgi:hypothetical protein
MGTWINADKPWDLDFFSLFPSIFSRSLLELRGNVEMLQEVNCTRVLPPALSGYWRVNPGGDWSRLGE